MLFVALSAMFANWRRALMLVQPETLLRWHRDMFRRFWTWRSEPKSPRSPRLPKDVIALIRIMALDNRLWGAERIQGELLELGVSVARQRVRESSLSASSAACTTPTRSRHEQNVVSWNRG
jgi:hypothetical protein